MLADTAVHEVRHPDGSAFTSTRYTVAWDGKLLDQKNVTAWLGLRNKAAHGQYAEYNADQVRVMQSGVSEFNARTS